MELVRAVSSGNFDLVKVLMDSFVNDVASIPEHAKELTRDRYADDVARALQYTFGHIEFGNDGRIGEYNQQRALRVILRHPFLLDNAKVLDRVVSSLQNEDGATILQAIAKHAPFARSFIVQLFKSTCIEQRTSGRRKKTWLIHFSKHHEMVKLCLPVARQYMTLMGFPRFVLAVEEKEKKKQEGYKQGVSSLALPTELQFSIYEFLK